MQKSEKILNFFNIKQFFYRCVDFQVYDCLKKDLVDFLCLNLEKISMCFEVENNLAPLICLFAMKQVIRNIF